MFENFLKSLYRNLIRNKFYSILNIVGLSVGIATALVILLYVQDELSYDKYNEKYDRIYRLEGKFIVNNKPDQFAVVPNPLGPAFKLEFPEVEDFVRFDAIGNTLIKYGDNAYYEDDFLLADSSVFKIFSYKLLKGNPEMCLTNPNTIVVSQEIAKKYFGNEDPLGKILIIADGHSLKVTGVMEDIPDNTHLKFDGLISIATAANDQGVDEYNSMRSSRFWRIGLYTYILLKENSSIEGVFDKFPAFYDKYMKELGEKYNLSFELMATPLAETHFRKGLGGERPSGNKVYLLIFSAVAAFILLIAAINYMNMATARSAGRAKEVGIRKVAGAYKSQLITQFLSESVILSLIALIIAFLLVWLVLPDFNNLADKSISLSLLKNPAIYFEILVITLFIGLLSGSYPAFFLSSFQPVRVLKGSGVKSGKKGGALRKILVVLQFVIAIFMIIGTIVVSQQIGFLRNKDLGFDKNNLVVMEVQDSAFLSKAKLFKDELLQSPDISAASSSTGVPGQINWIQLLKVEQENKMENITVILAQTDYDFVKTFGLEVINGRDFDKNMGTDANEAVIINETAAGKFGWGDDAIGKKIHFGFNRDGTGGRMLKVIGIVKDFNFKSLHNEIEPIIFFLRDDPGYFLTCRISPENQKETLAFIEQKWNEFNPKSPFSYTFMANSMDEMYKADMKIGTIIKITSILIIFIALLGLLGLSSFIAEQRTKEIGVRKVLGASVGNILMLLYKEFALLIFIAFIIAVPIAWWRLDIWLNMNFIYHISLSWVSFLLAGIIAFLVGMLSISYYIVKAATNDPVVSIKYE
jgi:putative ABC transport system permease protein